MYFVGVIVFFDRAVFADLAVIDAEGGQPILDHFHQLVDLQVITICVEDDGDDPASLVVFAAGRDG